ncbi:MAG: VIT domain-containing protein [Myxococcota bacterium]
MARSVVPSFGLVWLLLGIVLASCRIEPNLTPLVPESASEPRRPAPAPEPELEPVGAPPFSLTASDGTGLSLVSLEAEAIIRDPLALTQLELTFENPRGETMEGRFTVELPPGARVTRFAMEIGGRWQEAEIVEKQRARRTYEVFLHMNRDPALLERDTGNRFRARVFPIAPFERKRLLLTYTQTFPDPTTPYRLALEGLPKLERLDLNSTVHRPGEPPREQGRHLEYEVPTEDLVIRRDGASTMGIRDEEHVIARIEPLAGRELGPAQPLERLTVLVDTSASRALDFDATIDGLGALLRALARQSATTQVDIKAFDQSVVDIYQGTLAGMGAAELAALHRRRALGASNLGAALDSLSEGEHPRVLLVSDGLISAGPDSNADLRKKLGQLRRHGLRRIDALVVGSVRDDARLRRLVTGSLPDSGVLLEPSEDLGRAVQRLLRPALDGLRVDVPGARWWSPTVLDGVQPGDHVLVHADLPEGHPMEVQLSGPLHRSIDIPLHEVSSPLVSRAWMSARIEGLVSTLASIADETKWRSLRDTVIELSVRHRIFNDFTALLVLETEADYERFGLERRSLSDIMVVRDGRVQALSRYIEPAVEVEELPSRPPRRPPSRKGFGSISGVVTHTETNERMEALVVLQCACLEGHRETMTNDRGIYAFRDLPPGTYTIQVLSGQADVSKVVELPGGAKFRANFRINPDNEFRRVIRVEARPLESRTTTRLDTRLVTTPIRRPRPTVDDMVNERMNVPAEAPAAAPPPPPVDDPAYGTVGATIVQEFVETPTIDMDQREFTTIVDATPTASHDSVGISLAGTTGAESKFTIEGANISHSAAAHFSGRTERRYARVLFRKTKVEGPMGRRPVRSEIRSHWGEIEGCFWTELLEDPYFRGRLTVQFKLDREGKAVDIRRVRQTGLEEQEFLQCLNDEIETWRFDVSGSYAERTTITQTLVFRPNDGAPHGWFDDEELLEGSPTPPDPWANARNEILEAVGRGKTEWAWARAWAWREASPSDLLALLTLGQVARHVGRADIAARTYGSVIDLYPSRAEMLRGAAAHLESLDEAALDLAVDAYRKALAQRPDHPSSHRNLAMALLRQGHADEAFEVLAAGIDRPYPEGRFEGVPDLMRQDLGLIGSVWMAQRPAETAAIRDKLHDLGTREADTPSMRLVLTWETDATDIDLLISDADGVQVSASQPVGLGGEFSADVRTGFGPESFEIDQPRRHPYRLFVNYMNSGPSGYSMGKVQVLQHDGMGDVHFEDRPFVMLRGGERTNLGLVHPVR